MTVTRIVAFGTVLISLLLSSLPCFALEIVTCESEWAQLSREIGGGKVSAQTLTSRTQEPHHISPTSKSITLARAADLLICNNIRNEPRLAALINKANNPKIRVGQPGHMEAGQYATKSRPDGGSRSSASHHIQGDPNNILLVASALMERLSAIDPPNSRYYRGNYLSFSRLWSAEIKNWERLAAPLKGVAIVAQRNSCEYLCRWLRVREIAKLESTPGGIVNSTQMRKVLKKMNSDQVEMIVTGPYHSLSAVTWLARETKLPIVTLPIADDAMVATTGLEGFFDVSIHRMLNAIPHQKSMGLSLLNN
jgi:zinc/manganese transport system substrate-binding protein